MNKMIFLFLCLLALGILLLSRLYGGVDRTTVTSLQPAQLLGTWHEVARFDHPFERGLEDVEAHYTLNDNGTIRVENSGFNVTKGIYTTRVGRARFTSRPGRLKVSFFRPFWSEYNILERGDNPGWMLVGSRSSRYLWVLSRERHLPPECFEQILELARSRGYDTSRLMIYN